MAPIITLTTDFGDTDGFNGAMKGVILSICPDAVIHDISHCIPRQDVFAGALVLRNASLYYPRGCVHVAVVDPGVGSDRRAVVARTEKHLYVLPDNGLISFVAEETPILEQRVIENKALMLDEISRTFHGRDIFAPVGAHLAAGVGLDAVGPPAEALQRLTVPRVEARENTDGSTWIQGSIIYKDVFGNLITNIADHQIPEGVACVRAESHQIEGPASSYSDVALGRPLFLGGSSGYLEIAVNGGDASAQLGLNVGDKVSLIPK